MIEVRTRARNRTDRAGDPLDGLVNLFDVGIVLAVGFLLAALQALNVTPAALSSTQKSTKPAPSIVVQKNEKIVPLKPGSTRVSVQAGGSIGKVYKLPDGRLVYVTGK